MTRIAIIRHGQTQWNEGEGERFRGRADLDLDKIGIEQAKLTAARICQWQMSVIYSSPLKRASNTAKILASPFNFQVRLLDGLIDMDYGTWQGLSLKEAAADDSKLYALWLESPHLVTFPRGENLEQVRIKAVAALETLLPKHPEQTIVLVSHKVVCKVLICSILGLANSGFWQVEQDTCAISLVEVRNGFSVITLLNDACHLNNLDEN